MLCTQGPPGTGKSFVGVALVRLLLSMKVPQDYGPILVRGRPLYSSRAPRQSGRKVGRAVILMLVTKN